MDEYSFIGAHRASEVAAGREGHFLRTITVKPGLFHTAGSPENVITCFGYHGFVANGAGGHLVTEKGLCWNFLDRMVTDAKGLEGTHVLVEHFGLRATGKVKGPLALLVAAAHCSPLFLALEALEFASPLDFFFNIFDEESKYAFIYFTLLIKTGGKEEAVVVGCETTIGEELSIEEFIVLILGAKDTALIELLFKRQLINESDCCHFPIKDQQRRLTFKMP